MAQRDPLDNKLVVLIGGGGFLGRHLAQALLARRARLRIADRHPEKAYDLKPLANLGQIQFAYCDVAKGRDLAPLVAGADAVAYLIGTWGSDQHALQAAGAGRAAEAARAAGAGAFVYVSAIGADPASDSGYAATKGEGEARVLAAFPTATVIRPAVLFGEDDRFVNRFAGLTAALPVLPVFGPDAKLQPLWVDDAAAAIAGALADPAAHGGRTYEIAGPEVLTMEALHRRIAQAEGRRRALVRVPDALAGLFAALPGTPLTRDQWHLLRAGSVASGALPGLAELGVAGARPLGLFLDKWMTRFRKHGRFGAKRKLA